MMIILNIIIIFIGIIIMCDPSFSHTFLIPAAIAAVILIAAYLKKCIKNVKILVAFFLLGSAFMAFNYYHNRIYYAVWHGEIAKIKELADKGWDVNKEYCGRSLIDIAYEYGSAPSHAHFRHDNPIQEANRPEVIREILQTLIANELSQDGIFLIIDKTSGNNLLGISDFALKYIDINHVSDFSKFYYYFDDEQYRYSITHIAIRKANAVFLQKLLKLKPDPNLKDGSNMNILEYANKCDKEEIIKIVKDYCDTQKD